jgi:alkylated DNA repair dioxygenase AlkB
MGWHADDEPELAADHPIASLSLGVMRPLRFRPRPAAGRGAPSLAWGQPPLSLDLADGDLLLMEPPTQAHWQHGLPARLREGGERFNLTFRRIQT